MASCRGTCAQAQVYTCSVVPLWLVVGVPVFRHMCTCGQCGGTCCQVGVSGAEEGSQCCSDIHTTDKGTLHSQRRSWCDLEDVADVSAPSTAQLQSI